jgi:hypothetical protein
LVVARLRNWSRFNSALNFGAGKTNDLFHCRHGCLMG